MLIIDPASQTERENYKLMTGIIIPRPIAFVTTLSKNGVINAAPFSYFNIVTADPPMVSVSIQRRNGIAKDTSRNAKDIGSFVIHVTDEENVGLANQTAADLLPDESEVELAKLTVVSSQKIKVPGIKEAKIRMECELDATIPLGGSKTNPSCDLIIGRVVCFHIENRLYENGRIDARLLQPVGRLAGKNYGKIGEIFSLERPQ